MSSKRTHALSDDGAVEEQPISKRARSNGNPKARAHQNAYIDSTWGQKYVFSSREDATTVPQDFDSDFECEGDAEAMAYLNSVRQQAMGIPHLLVAPRVPIGPQLPADLQQSDEEEGEIETRDEHLDRSVYDQGTGDFRGRYEDGAYIAQPDWEWERTACSNSNSYSNPRDPERGEEWDPVAALEEEDAEAALCDAYYESLRNRYSLIRERLQARPPASALAALPHSNGFDVGQFGPKSSVFAVWNRRLRDTDPWLAQVASMDKDAVIRVLRIVLSGKFLRRGYDLAERTSRWLWALLARLPDRGEMSHIDVGWVRDLGRRAVLMTQSLGDMANLREALEGEGMDLGVHEAVDESSDNEDALQSMEVEEEDGVALAQSDEPSPGNPPSGGDVPRAGVLPAISPKENREAHAEDQVPVEDDQKSEAMDCSEDGEVADDNEIETLETAKARILAQLDQAPAAKEEKLPERRESSAKDRLRARLNMRATLNMILTVAGEFYGQRDLLEFRDPFPGM